MGAFQKEFPRATWCDSPVSSVEVWLTGTTPFEVCIRVSLGTHRQSQSTYHSQGKEHSVTSCSFLRPLSAPGWALPTFLQ